MTPQSPQLGGASPPPPRVPRPPAYPVPQHPHPTPHMPTPAHPVPPAPLAPRTLCPMHSTPPTPCAPHARTPARPTPPAPHLSQVAPDPALTAVPQVPRLSPEPRLQTCQDREETQPLRDPRPCPPGGSLWAPLASSEKRVLLAGSGSLCLGRGSPDPRVGIWTPPRACCSCPTAPSCTGLQTPGAAPTRPQASDRTANGVQARSRM